MELRDEECRELTETARRVRREILTMVTEAASGHPGGSLSAVEILTALYFKVMNVDPQRPELPERDRFVLSKGHAAPALYAVLAERGFFPVSQLNSLRKLGSMLQGHPDMKRTPGVEISTGSLGQGFSAAVGMALGARLNGGGAHVYALLGDGELQEGQVWEAAMAAAHYRLDGLTAFIDHNGYQIDGPVTEVMSPEPVSDKFRAFGWEVFEADGHDFTSLLSAIGKARSVTGRPQVIVCRTVKGKGVSFMEHQAGWHGKAPTREQLDQALAELA
ncbi:MAG: transketolase [Chloroflexota bacterium]